VVERREVCHEAACACLVVFLRGVVGCWGTQPMVMKTPLLQDPVFYELYNSAQENPELYRILDSMRRHMKKNTYDRDRTIKTVNRFVMETTAINLHREKVEVSPAPITPKSPKVSWFTRYPAHLRLTVSEKIVAGWEREIRSEMEQ
jgi:hypothetical protein